jgi:hypothetical protein
MKCAILNIYTTIKIISSNHACMNGSKLTICSRAEQIKKDENKL